MTNKLSDTFLAAFGETSARLNPKVDVQESNQKQILESRISEVDARINSARIGGVGNIGKLTEEKARLQAELSQIEETVKFNGRTFKDYKTFNGEKEANKFLEKNDGHGVIGEKGGKVYVAKMDDMGEEKNLDPVNPKAVKKKFDDRKDKDLDNDGDTDSSDEYLHKRRKAISKAMKSEGKKMSAKDMKNALASDEAKAQPKGKVSLKKAPWDTKEEVELDENRMLAPAFNRVIKAHKYESDSTGKNHTWPQGDRSTKIKHNGTHVVTYNQHDGSKVHKTPASLNKYLNALHDHEVDLKSVQESVELDEAPQPKWKVQIGKKHYTVTARNTAEANTKAKKLATKDGNVGVGGKIERIKEEVEELDEKVYARDYDAGSEKSQFGGYVPMVKHKAKGHMMYRGATSYKTPEAAAGHAEAYLKGYEQMGERAANRAVREYETKNKSEINESASLSLALIEKADAVEIMRKREQMKNISSSDKDKLSKIRAMLNKEKKGVKEEVELDEAKDSYTINHKTFSSAVQHAKDHVEKQGYTIEGDEWDRKVAMGPKKPSAGKTNRYTIELMKGGKPTKKMLQMQVYYDEGRYELNMYIS